MRFGVLGGIQEKVLDGFGSASYRLGNQRRVVLGAARSEANIKDIVADGHKLDDFLEILVKAMRLLGKLLTTFEPSVRAIGADVHTLVLFKLYKIQKESKRLCKLTILKRILTTG